MDYELRVKLTEKFIETVPYAIKVLADVYNTTESKKNKRDCAHVLLTRFTMAEVAKIAELHELNIKELIDHHKEVVQAEVNAREKARMMAQKRRHHMKEEGALTHEEWQETLWYFNYECAYCGDDDTQKLTFEHVIPFSKGGPFTKENIIPACQYCNGSKNDRDLEDWYKSKDYYNEKRLNKIVKFLGENK